MADKRMYRCQKCQMFYWGQELIPGGRSFPTFLSVPCPTPGCHGLGLFGQGTPGEASCVHGIVIFPIACGVLHWGVKLGWLPATGLAIAISMVVMLLSRRLHRPGDPSEDQRYAANELMRLGGALSQKDNLKWARMAYERAFTIIGTDVDQKLEAAILGRLANVEKKMGEFSKALDHYLSALKLAEKISDISGRINRLNNIGALLGDNLHNPGHAIPYVEDTVTLARDLHDPPRLALMLLHLGKRKREAGQLDQARNHICEAINIAQEISAPEPLAEALYERACIALSEDKKEKAVTDLKKALGNLGHAGSPVLRKKLKGALSKVQSAISENAIVQILPPGIVPPRKNETKLSEDISPEALAALQPCMAHMDANRLDLAADCLLRILQMDCIRTDPRARLLAGNNLGDILRVLGRIEEAEKILRDTIVTAEQVNELNLECMARLNLGIVLRVKGSWAESRECLDRALDIASNNGFDQEKGRILHMLGNIYRDGYDYELAEKYYIQAEDFAKKCGDVLLQGSLYQSWGNLHIRQKRYQEAEMWYKKALDIGLQTKDSGLQGVAQHMLGNILKRRAQIEVSSHKRRELLEEALNLLKQSVSVASLGQERGGRAQRIHSLANVELNLGYIDKAQEHYDQAIRIFRKHNIASPDVAACLNQFGALLIHLGKTRAGADNILAASTMDNTMIGQAFSFTSEEAWLEFLHHARARLNDLISLVAEGAPLCGVPSMKQACADVVLRRKGVTLEFLVTQRDIAISGRHPVPEVDDQIKHPDRKTVASHLPPGSVLVEFIRFDFFKFPLPDLHAQWCPARYAAFVIHTGSPDSLSIIDLGESEPIDRMIVEFRDSITQCKSTTTANIGAALRTAIFDPLLNALKDCKRLLLAPDADLTRVPFEVLPVRDGHYLIDDYKISYLSAGRDTLRLGKSAIGQPSDPLVIADPDFDLSITEIPIETKAKKLQEQYLLNLLKEIKFERFELLEGTKSEGKCIANKLGIKKPWLGEAALKARVKAYHSPRILHLATHGFFLEDLKSNPNKKFHDLDAIKWQVAVSADQPTKSVMKYPLLRSGLALAGFNTWKEGGALPEEAENGILTAEDVSCLDLLNTELVVLSACETGLGEVYTGEGVFGLRRAFVLAGAKTLVMSLWKVPDDETKELMEEYYNHMLAGQSRADALRNAQLTIKKKYPDPWYWGAFICQGEPSPLPIAKDRD